MLKYLEKIHQNLNKDIKFLFKKIDEIEQGFQNLLIVKDEKLLKKDFYYVKQSFFDNISIIDNFANSHSLFKIFLAKIMICHNKKILINLEKDLKKVSSYYDFQKIMLKYKDLFKLWKIKLAIIC